ncbi:iron-containing alcohol dehydrogenase [Myxococcota bacterium]|nr:iron-containing alcohol dehydrogenase [Myxococcota bacterium]MBU1430504.1 iron-containing alcohol dehydrogenase [Myxococcota bacterium]MBU1898224.1 iron-containing alcohol dehydrogenase [Myxococcota bacterium]
MKLTDLVPVPIPDDPTLPLEVYLGVGARSALPQAVARHCGPAPIWIADERTWAAALLGEISDARLIFQGEIHADDERVEQAARAMTGHSGAVAVGSGTINDIVKRAAALSGLPFVTLATAASMNGYASAIAAILSGGLKTTVPARPARAVILDTEILAAAPLRLGQAGLGDLLSKPVSDADWRLGHLLYGDAYHDLPSRLVDAAVEAAAAAASGLLARQPAAYEALARALLLSGVAMVVAGSSSPASGGEHLISHLWDMEAHVLHRPLNLHGAQVGVATRISAALYARLLREETPRLTPLPRWADEAARIKREHGPLAEVILGPAQEKHARAEARREALTRRWPELRASLRAHPIPGPQDIGAILEAAGAPRTLSALGFSVEEGISALIRARDIRARLTVLDIAFDMGVLPGEAGALIAASGVSDA